MDYGLKVINDINQVQIDSFYENLILAEKRIVYPNTAYPLANGGGMYYTNVDFSNCITPVLAIRNQASGNRVTVSSTQNLGGGVYRFAVASVALSSGVEVFLFDKPRVPTTAGKYGLKVFKGDGSVAYDSRRQSLKVIDYITQNGFDGPAVNVNYGPVKAAVIISQASQFQDIFFLPPGIPDTAYYIANFGVASFSSGNLLTVDTFALFTNIQEFPPGTGPSTNFYSYITYNSNFPVIDVTNF